MIPNDSAHSVTAPLPTLPFDMAAPYGLDAPAKQAYLLPTLNALTRWHAEHCQPYANIQQRLFAAGPAARLEDVPYLPVRLFKTLDLRSVPQAEVIKTLTSSGTTGQAVSRIALDRETSVRQTRVLAAIMASFLGKHRLPMVIVDSADLLKDRTQFNARAAGILGFSVFGRDHHYSLDRQLELQLEPLRAWLELHSDTPVLVFGFTYIVWQKLVRALEQYSETLRFPKGSVLIHGGGWKRLLDQQVDNTTFKTRLATCTGIDQVYNYYGMVEQVGSIFMECEHGHLHAPVFADVIIRDTSSLQPLPPGVPGAVQVLSALPTSYPGHSLLTEDLGRLEGDDDCPCGRAGRHFTILGRLPQVELRGCSDTRAMT